MTWNVYLSGEIHTDWRDQIIAGAAKLDLPINFTSAVTDHDASDAAGGARPSRHEKPRGACFAPGVIYADP